MRRLQNVFLLVYIVLYIWVWKLLLDVGNLGYLKPYAFTWIASSFLCLLINRKKTFPFVAFFGGSILGPIGVVMLLFSKKDIRLLKEDEKDENFYKREFTQMEKSIRWLMGRDVFLDFRATFYVTNLSVYADYCKLTVKLPIVDYSGNFSRPAEPHIYLREWIRVLLEFNKEYRQRFGKAMPEIENLVHEIQESWAVKLIPL